MKPTPHQEGEEKYSTHICTMNGIERIRKSEHCEFCLGKGKDVLPPTTQSWKEEFVKDFPNLKMVVAVGEERDCVDPRDKIIDFISQTLATALKEQEERLVKEIEKSKKVHREFECNGAYNGKGCYEDWCEDQNCRNAPKEYNQALSDCITIIKSTK